MWRDYICATNVKKAVDYMADDKDKLSEGNEPVSVNDDGSRADQSSVEVFDQLTDVAKLRQQLEAKEKEANDNYNRFLRQLAELENFKKRTTREKEEAIRFANETIIKDILPVMDNLERALAHARGGGNGKPLVEGVELVLKGLSEVLIKHGVVQISALGDTFDPLKHEAMAQVETKTHEPNTVIEEHHKGYFLQDRLLRPALVSIAKSPKTAESKNEGAKVENGSSDD